MFHEVFQISVKPGTTGRVLKARLLTLGGLNASGDSDLGNALAPHQRAHPASATTDRRQADAIC